jgi:hypothetical protein
MADIQMSFPIFALLARGGIENLPHIQAWKKSRKCARLATNARTRGPLYSGEGKCYKLRIDDNVCASSGYFFSVISEF